MVVAYQRIQDDSQRLLNRDVESIVFLVKVGGQVVSVTLISKVTSLTRPPCLTLTKVCLTMFKNTKTLLNMV